MKYIFVLFVSFSIALSSFAGEDFGDNSSLQFKKILNQEIGVVDDNFCVRDCPKYPGGEEAFLKAIYSQLNYTVSKDCAETQVRFVISQNGKIKDVTIIHTGNEEYDREITKAVASAPNFLPLKDGQKSFYAWLTIKCPKG